MSPRRRAPGNTRLPPNLYPHDRGGFRYRDPLTRKRTYVPGPESSAIAYAKKRNANLGIEDADSVGFLLEQYEQTLAGAQTSQRELKRIIGRYRRAWGTKRIRGIGRLVLGEVWATLGGPHAVQKHRQLWIQFMAWCIAKGRLDVNEAAMTLEPTPAQKKRKRQRHTDEGYAATYAAADEWLQIAMELAVSSLQRRGDLVRLTRDDVRDQMLHIEQAKSVRDGVPAMRLAIKIAPGSRLARAVARALSYPVLGSTLVRRLPERRKARSADDVRGEPRKALMNQVNASYLSQAFAQARDRAGAYSALDPEQRPSLHDLRSYGIWLYKRAGYPTEYRQALAGHATQRMTVHYGQGYGDWQVVEAGL